MVNSRRTILAVVVACALGCFSVIVERALPVAEDAGVDGGHDAAADGED